MAHSVNPAVYHYFGECSGGTFCDEYHREKLHIKAHSRVTETKLYTEAQMIKFALQFVQQGSGEHLSLLRLWEASVS